METLSTLEELERLRPEWSDLFRRCPGATPFQSPAWQLPWWKHLGGGTLWVMALRRAGCLVGVAPFFLWGQSGQPRTASLLGAGISDYQELLIEPGAAAEGTAAVLERLEAERARFDVCDLQELRGESPLLAARIPPELAAQRLPIGLSPVLELPPRFADLKQGLSWRFRRRLRNAENRLRRAGQSELLRAGTGELETLFDALVRLHSLRWIARGEAGLLGEASVQAFHREAAAAFQRLGLLRLFALQSAGQLAAVFYGFHHGGRAYAYLTGFDPALEELSPGVLLLSRAIEGAIDDGCHELDMLRGQEPYKYDWAPCERRRWRLVITSATGAPGSAAG